MSSRLSINIEPVARHVQGQAHPGLQSLHFNHRRTLPQLRKTGPAGCAASGGSHTAIRRRGSGPHARNRAMLARTSPAIRAQRGLSVAGWQAEPGTARSSWIRVSVLRASDTLRAAYAVDIGRSTSPEIADAAKGPGRSLSPSPRWRRPACATRSNQGRAGFMPSHSTERLQPKPMSSSAIATETASVKTKKSQTASLFMSLRTIAKRNL